MKVLCCMILVHAVLLSSTLARPQAYDGHDEQENAWPIGATQKYQLSRHDNENKYQGVNTEEANIEHYPPYFTCFRDRKCRVPLPPMDCCFVPTNYIIKRGRCCPCSGRCKIPVYDDPE